MAIDYLSKWIEENVALKNDAKVVNQALQKNIFPKFGVPQVVISDRGSHFIVKQLKNLIKKFEFKRRVATLYHQHTNN